MFIPFLTQSLNYALVAGRMPLRNPTTRCSLREPKMKELEKAHQAVERIDYISVVQKGRDAKEHNILVLRDIIIDRIRNSIEYWVNMA
jgi:hypothetical protein